MKECLFALACARPTFVLVIRSVGRSVGWSVGQSGGWLVSRSFERLPGRSSSERDACKRVRACIYAIVHACICMHALRVLHALRACAACAALRALLRCAACVRCCAVLRACARPCVHDAPSTRWQVRQSVKACFTSDDTQRVLVQKDTGMLMWSHGHTGTRLHEHRAGCRQEVRACTAKEKIGRMI